MPEAGFYLVDIVEGKLSQSKSGSDQVVLSISATNRAVDGEWIPLTNSIERRIYMSLKGGAESRTMAKLQELGFEGDFRDMKFLARECTVECKFEEYQGQTKEKWDMPNEQREIPDAPDDSIRTWNSKWKTQHAVPGGKATSPPPDPNSENTPEPGTPF